MFATSRTWWKRSVAWTVIAASAASGCNRFQYRQAADSEVACLVEEKSNDPRWAREPDFSIDMDPRSRFHEPYVQEEPPMPPDDPASHEFMHCIDGKKGWKHWHDNGDRLELENSTWRDSLSTYTRPGKDGKIRMGLDDAVRIGLINSSSYQTQTETLYLSALDVSTERFRFDLQFFGGVGNNYRHAGSQTLGGESNSLTTTIGPNLDFPGFQMRRKTASAAQFLVGFANSFVWQFSGQDTDNTTTLLNFSLVQPLLRAGGRVVGLEQLTIVERNLLANLRAFERYRQGFYTSVAIGSLDVQGPQRRGGVFGAGLEGFTGLGGGFAGVGDAIGQGGGGLGQQGGGGSTGGVIGLAGGGAGNVGGFIGLLQQLQQIRNNEDSLNLQLRTLTLLESNLDAGLIDISQVDQFRQSIETQRATLLQNRNGLQTQLDSFKLQQLGMPPNLEIELDDNLIRQFQFIDVRITDAQNELGDFIRRFGDLPQEPPLEALQEGFATWDDILSRALPLFDLVQKDLDQLDVAAKARLVGMSREEQTSYTQDRQRLSDGLRDLREHVDTTAGTLSGLKEGITPETRKKTADQFIALLVEVQDILGELSLVQARARLEQVSVKPIDLEAPLAVEIARSNRLDWMNNRAALVDQWRLIEFNANRLKSNFNITFDGDLSTLGNNPVAFRAPTGRLRAGFQFDPPLTRLIERNIFREALISYQRSRRSVIQYEDGINGNMRQRLRDLERDRVNLEIQRRAVAIAIRRVDQTRETLNKPVPPAAPGGPPAQFGPTAAQNLLSAVSALSDAQNNFMSVWLRYEATRMQLMRDLGVMQIDDHGLWIDEPFDVIKLRVCSDQYPLPPDIPSGWLQLVPPEPAPPEPAPAKK
jgi:hypothetical protein